MVLRLLELFLCLLWFDSLKRTSGKLILFLTKAESRLLETGLLKAKSLLKRDFNPCLGSYKLWGVNVSVIRHEDLKKAQLKTGRITRNC